MITFLRPEEKQPPNFATFKVPLTFNKLDLRDYLHHAYGVATLAVRSQLRQRMPRRSKVHGRITRPPPIKTMTVELAKPFVWPARPDEGEAREAWQPAREARRERMLKQQEEWQRKVQVTGRMPLHDELADQSDRVSVRREARRLLEHGGWSNGRALDPRFANAVSPDADAAAPKTRQAKKSDKQKEGKADAPKEEVKADSEKAERKKAESEID